MYAGIIPASFRSLGNFKAEIEALISFCTLTSKKSEFCFKIFGTSFSYAAFQTGFKKNVLVMQLFLDLIRFMFRWSLYLTIIPEIVFSSRERVWVEKLCLFGIFKIGVFIKYSLTVFWQFQHLGTGFYDFEQSNFRTYFDLI